MPSAQGLHVDRLLNEIVIGFKQDRTEFIAEQACPPIPAEKEHDLFGRYDKSTFFRRPDLNGIIRAPGTPYKKADYKVLSDSFRCEEYGLEHALDDRTAKLADAAYAVSEIPTELLTMHVLREKEIRVKNLLTSTANLTNNVTLAGASQFNDVGSDPVSVFRTACKTVLQNSGMIPNLAIIPWEVWIVLEHHPMLLDRIKYKDAKRPTLDGAGFFDIFAENFAPNAKMLVPKVVYDSSVEGAAFAGAFLWGKDMVVGYVDPSPVKAKPTLCYTFENAPLSAISYRKEDITSDVSRVREIAGEKLIDASLGYLIKSAVV